MPWNLGWLRTEAMTAHSVKILCGWIVLVLWLFRLLTIAPDNHFQAWTVGMSASHESCVSFWETTCKFDRVPPPSGTTNSYFIRFTKNSCFYPNPRQGLPTFINIGHFSRVLNTAAHPLPKFYSNSNEDVEFFCFLWLLLLLNYSNDISI